MASLSELITDKTPIITLKNDSHVSLATKEKVLGSDNYSLSKKDDYLKMMYIMNNIWYYFKKEEENASYPMYLFDELMGSYMASLLSLKSLEFFIAQTKHEIGLASKNFRNNNCTYHFGNFLHETSEKEYGISLGRDIGNLDALRILCNNTDNTLQLIDEFIRLLAIDSYMLQTDRGPANIQFAVDNETKETHLGTIYDFSNCKDEVASWGIYLKNCIVIVEELGMPLLIRECPEYLEYVSLLIDQGFASSWDKICDNYCFNKETRSYEEVKKYYKVKENKQKDYFRNFIKKDSI